MRLRLLALPLVSFLLCLPAYGRHWTDPVRKAVDKTRVGLSVAEAQQLIGGRPWGTRIFIRDGKRINESSYPTAKDRWTTLVFEDGKLVSRRDESGRAFPVMNVTTFSEADNAKRLKLQGVGLGMPVADLDRIGVAPDMTITSQMWREARESKEMKEAEMLAASFASKLGVATPLDFKKLDEFDETRSYQLEGESFTVLVKDGKVAELSIVADPDEKWAEQVFMEMLSKTKPTTEAFAKIQPGDSVVAVVMAVGVPESENSVRTEHGEVKVMKYRVSRRERYEVEIQNDKVTRVTRSSAY